MSNSFLKIIDFESFREFCKNRVGIICHEVEFGRTYICSKADKTTMMNCPIWKLFKDFNTRSDYERNGEKQRKTFRDSEEIESEQKDS